MCWSKGKCLLVKETLKTANSSILSLVVSNFDSSSVGYSHELSAQFRRRTSHMLLKFLSK